MNTVILTGRLTKDFELRNNVARSSIAVKRSYGNDTDYIDIVVFKKTAEFCAKYTRKGDMVAVIGSWNTFKDKEGKTHHSCSVIELQLIGQKEATVVYDKERLEKEIDERYSTEEEDVVISDDDLPF